MAAEQQHSETLKDLEPIQKWLSMEEEFEINHGALVTPDLTDALDGMARIKRRCIEGKMTPCG